MRVPAVAGSFWRALVYDAVALCFFRPHGYDRTHSLLLIDLILEVVLTGFHAMCPFRFSTAKKVRHRLNQSR